MTADGLVYTWGENTYGQLGDGATANKTVAMAMPYQKAPGDTEEGTFMGHIRQVVGGTDHSVMIRNDGYVMTAGRNEHGQLGIDLGTYPQVSIPTIAGNSGVTGFAADVAVNGVLTTNNVITMGNTQTVTVQNVRVTNAGGLNLFDMLLADTEAIPVTAKVTADSGIVEIVETTPGLFTITPVEEAVGTVVITVTDLASGQSLSFTLIIDKLPDQISRGRDRV